MTEITADDILHVGVVMGYAEKHKDVIKQVTGVTVDPVRLTSILKPLLDKEFRAQNRVPRSGDHEAL